MRFLRSIHRSVHTLAKRRRIAAQHDAHVRAYRGLSALERYHWKYANDPAFVVNMRMRVAIKKALRGGKCGRAWEAVVGYTLDDLVARLQATMPPGYSMSDFRGGALHIDHIVPRRVFDAMDPDQLRRCWALDNLQALTSGDNLRKGGRLTAGLNA